MENVKKISAILITCISLFCVSSAGAITHSFEDTWTDWNNLDSYYSGRSEENGTPKVEWLHATVEDNKLTKVVVELSHEQRRSFDSLFINTSWDGGTTWEDWDHFIIDGLDNMDGGFDPVGVTNGDVANTNGLYDVIDTFYDNKTTGGYTTAGTIGRAGNPNGVDNDYLDLDSWQDLGGTYSDDGNSIWSITYDFSILDGGGLSIDGGFYVAYAPWCANDVAGGGFSRGTTGGDDPIPEPATMLLFGTGLLGLAGSRFRSRKKSDSV